MDDSADPPRSTGVLRDLPLPSGFLVPLVIRHAAGAVVTIHPDMHRRMREFVPVYFGFAETREKDRLDLRHLDEMEPGDAQVP